jgi:iron complex outermembrane recepter protein
MLRVAVLRYFKYFVILSVICSTPFTNAQVSKSLESPRKEIIYFDLPTQTLQTGLIEFAMQSNFTIIVENDILKGFRSLPLVGPHDPIEGLTILLADAPLSFEYQANTKSIIIVPAKPTETPQGDEPPTIPTLVYEPDEIVVTGVQYPFRYNTISNSQIYGTSSVFNTARFISVLPSTLVSDQAPTDLADLLKLSSGITPGDGVADSNDDFYVRGFPRYGIYLDGARLSADTGIKQMPANIERVEILKGPSTLFYGQAEPGGIVNVVRKKPLSKAHQKLTLAGGTDNRQLESLDLTGKMFTNTDTQGLYRLVMANEKQDIDRDLRDVSRQLIAPSFNLTFEKNTLIDIAYNYQKNQQTREQGTIIVVPLGGSVDIVAVDEPAHQARPDFYAKHHQLDIGLQHYFASSWFLKSTLTGMQEQRYGIRATRNALLTGNLLPDGNALDPALTFVILDGIAIPIPFGTSVIGNANQNNSLATIRSIFDEEGEEKSLYFKTLLDGSFEVMTLSNNFSMGVDWYRQHLAEKFVLEHRSDIYSLTQVGNTGDSAKQIIEGVFKQGAALGKLTAREQALQYDDYGIFFLDSIELNNYWKTSFGGRYTQTSGQYQTANSLLFEELTSYNKFSSEFGLRYEPIEALALYFNYSEGLKSNYQIDDIGTKLSAPETSHQYELGAKMLLLDGTLVSTIAAYKINKENVVNVQFIDGFRNAIIGGEQRTAGVDMDFTYQITTNINLLGSFSRISPEISTGEYAGNIPALASKQVASAFFSYRFNKGWAKDLSLTMGGYHVGERFIDNANSVPIDAFDTLDVGAAYEFDVVGHDMKLQFAVKNVMDKKYVSSSEGFIRSNMGAGRSFLGTIVFAY